MRPESISATCSSGMACSVRRTWSARWRSCSAKGNGSVTVLSSLGLIEHARLEEAVGIHTREILFSALDRPDVTFSFEDADESSLATDLVCPQSTGQVILEATRRVLDPELVKRVLGDASRVLTLSNDPLLRCQKITLTPTDGFVLSRIDGTLSARDVVGLIPAAPSRTPSGASSACCAPGSSGTEPRARCDGRRPVRARGTSLPAGIRRPLRCSAPRQRRRLPAFASTRRRAPRRPRPRPRRARAHSPRAGNADVEERSRGTGDPPRDPGSRGPSEVGPL